MARAKWSQSIAGRIRGMRRQVMLLLIVPVIISLTLVMLLSARYSGAMERMGTIASLKEVIAEEIPGAVWRVVSGRETFDQSGVTEMIARVNNTIERVTGQTGDRDRLELIIARRTMDTLSAYVDRVRENLRQGALVVENEAVLGEIRDVAELVQSMLNDYITGEIDTAARMSVHLRQLALLTALAELLLVIATLILLSRTAQATDRFIREPIEKLERVAARLAEGDMSARLPLTNVEELKNLTGQVNVMADNLDDMMKQRVLDERALKKAELRTLQAQINPHFLYNTLDAIVWKAEAGDQREVINLTRALSDFFRISLSSGADWIPIAQEKKHIAGYLSIQKTRYRDILNYEIDLPDEIGEYYILKLLLQPLVENALYHGIKYVRGGGVIRVSGRREGDRLTFVVSDTGRGMDEGTLSALKASLREGRAPAPDAQHGFGLGNVDLRIRLYYNQADGLDVQSGPGGTRVSFTVPCRTKEDIEHD